MHRLHAHTPCHHNIPIKVIHKQTSFRLKAVPRHEEFEGLQLAFGRAGLIGPGKSTSVHIILTGFLFDSLHSPFDERGNSAMRGPSQLGTEVVRPSYRLILAQAIEAGGGGGIGVGERNGEVGSDDGWLESHPIHKIRGGQDFIGAAG
jgi:hypothetical protein